MPSKDISNLRSTKDVKQATRCPAVFLFAIAKDKKVGAFQGGGGKISLLNLLLMITSLSIDTVTCSYIYFLFFFCVCIHLIHLN